LPPSHRPTLMGRVRTYFLTGVIVATPIFVTAYTAWSLISWVDRAITPLIPPDYNPETYLRFSVPGLGLVVLLAGLTLFGALFANILGRWFLSLGEALLERLPVVRSLYGTVKQIMETVLAQNRQQFSKPVLVEFPRAGMFSIGFLTNDRPGPVQAAAGPDLVAVYVPTTPNPTSGYLVYVARGEIKPLEMSAEEAAKLIISGGIVPPEDKDAKAAEAAARPRLFTRANGRPGGDPGGGGNGS